MTRNERENWITNIENCAGRIQEEIGYEAVESVLQRHGARSVDDLDAAQLSDVFSELYALEADLK